MYIVTTDARAVIKPSSLGAARGSADRGLHSDRLRDEVGNPRGIRIAQRDEHPVKIGAQPLALLRAEAGITTVGIGGEAAPARQAARMAARAQKTRGSRCRPASARRPG